VGALLEVAAATATPVVPVRIVSSAAEAVSPDLPDFPPGLGRLQICLGAPLMPETFSTSDTADKIALVSQSFAALDAIPVQPVSGDATFIARVIERMKISGLPESLAVLLECGLPQK